MIPAEIQNNIQPSKATQLIFHNFNNDTFVNINLNKNKVSDKTVSYRIFNLEWIDSSGKYFASLVKSNDTVRLENNGSFDFDSIVEIRIYGKNSDYNTFFIKRYYTYDFYQDSIGIYVKSNIINIIDNQYNYEYLKRKCDSSFIQSYFAKVQIPNLFYDIKNKKIRYIIKTEDSIGLNNQYIKEIKYLDSLNVNSQINDILNEKYKNVLNQKLKISKSIENNEDSSANQQRFNLLTESNYLYDKLLAYQYFLNLNRNKFMKTKIYSNSSAGETNIDITQLLNYINISKIDEISKKIFIYKTIEDAFIGDWNFSKMNIIDTFLNITKDTVYLNEILSRQKLVVVDSIDLKLVNKFGDTTTLTKLIEKGKDKVLFVDFWASWCQPCLSALPASARLRKEYQGKDIDFIYLAKGDAWEKWRLTSRKEGLSELAQNYFISNSKTTSTFSKLKIYSIPRYLIFDKKGRLYMTDAPTPEDPYLKKVINKLLNNL